MKDGNRFLSTFFPKKTCQEGDQLSDMQGVGQCQKMASGCEKLSQINDSVLGAFLYCVWFQW